MEKGKKVRKITISSPAKINLSLDVTGIREDGYHLISSVMQTVSLCDTVQIMENGKKKISLFCNLPYVPRDERNIVWKAAELFFRETGLENPGIFLNIRKKIPVGAGLAGGSGNAAAVLLGLNTLFSGGLSEKQLAELGAKCGADVPYCFYGGTMLATGIGDQLEEVTPMPACHILLAKPGRGAATPKIYQLLDEMGIEKHPDTENLLAALKQDAAAVAAEMGNVLEPVTASLCDEIIPLKEEMLKSGALGAMMSGSGSTVFGIFSQDAAARQCAKEIKDRHQNCFTYVAKPVCHGVKIK